MGDVCLCRHDAMEGVGVFEGDVRLWTGWIFTQDAGGRARMIHCRADSRRVFLAVLVAVAPTSVIQYMALCSVLDATSVGS